MESYKHACAKETVARWIKDNPVRYFDEPDGIDVTTEHPVVLDANNKLRGKFKWDPTPSYDWLIHSKFVPA